MVEIYRSLFVSETALTGTLTLAVTIDALVIKTRKCSDALRLYDLQLQDIAALYNIQYHMTT